MENNRAQPAPPEELAELVGHRKYVQDWLQQMYATMIDPVEDATGTIADTCKLLLDAATRDRQQLSELAELRRDRDALRECLRDSIVALAEFERLALMRNRYREPLSVALHIRVMIDKILKALRKYPLDTALAASKEPAP